MAAVWQRSLQEVCILILMSEYMYLFFSLWLKYQIFPSLLYSSWMQFEKQAN